MLITPAVAHVVGHAHLHPLEIAAWVVLSVAMVYVQIKRASR